MKAFLRLSITLSTVVVLTACASVDTRLKREFEQMRRGPVGAPYKTITNFSSSLRCMDQMMLEKNIKDIPILIEAIDDKTESVNAGTRDMLISAISEMTVRSHAIKVIAYGKDSTNLISFMKVAKLGKAYKQVPMFDIQGSISQHDESIVSTGNSFGLFSKKEGGGGYGNSTSLSTIAMDLNVLDVSDMSVLPGVNARNSIAVLRKGKSFDMDASINKLGIYFDISLSRTEGKTQALRNLIELSAVELIGKLTKVPYWQCLGAHDQYVQQTNNHLFAQQTVDNESHAMEQAHENQTYNQAVSEASVITNAQVPTRAARSMRSNGNDAVVPAKEEGAKGNEGLLVHKCCRYGS